MAATVRLKIILLAIMSIRICFTFHYPIKCGHLPPKPEEVLHHIHIEPAHVIRKRNIDQKLRIKLIYDASVHRLPKDKFSTFNKILPAAVKFWEETLRVRPMYSPILLSRSVISTIVCFEKINNNSTVMVYLEIYKLLERIATSNLGEDYKMIKFISFCRKCEQNKLYYLKNKKHHYCSVSCENETKCGEVVVPEDHLDVCRTCNGVGNGCVERNVKGKGVSGADFLFYVSAMQTDRCQKGSTIAYAAHCQLEAAFDRPIAGHANLCPEAINTKAQDQETLFATIKHEILHALGFSVSLFAYFRDENGKPRTPRLENGKPELNETLKNWQWSDKVIRTVTRKNWRVRGGTVQKTVHMIVTPRVQKEVRRHFNCPTLEGAELEDQGGEGTELTHWEKRIFENEAMTGIHTQNPVYSHLTLALLEDTGWYSADFSKAENLTWGQSLGCDFATKSCLNWMEIQTQNNRNIYPFCKIVKRDPLYTSCSEDRTGLTVCNLVDYVEDLPKAYQNFESLSDVPSNLVGQYGGSLVLADYCPFFQEFHWKTQNVSIRGSKCIYAENTIQPESNLALELYSSNSRCFDHAPVPWEEKHCSHSRHKQHYGSGCYEFSCSEGRLKVKVLDRLYTCYKEDQLLQVTIAVDDKLHSGQIICPRCQELCKVNIFRKNYTITHTFLI
uniref:Leishmanolysin-like peptidase n=1 Tax=Strigamia maritima TaxID=126957 RepID=T1JG38_STRMM